MALTKAQWLEKIKTFVPSWWFENERNQLAVFSGMAAILAEIDQESDGYFAQTFILQATAPVLDAMGDERGVDRLDGETDGAYALRIQNIANSTNLPAIKAIVDRLLAVGECTIKEDYKDLAFCNRDSSCNRHELLTDYHYNVFTILVPAQVHPSYSFLSRDNFLSRGDFIGAQDASDSVYGPIVAAVNKAKALGVLYKIVELAS